MGRLGFIAALLFGLIALPVAAQERVLETGIARSNLIWEAPQKQAEIIAGIKRTGVRWFRDAFASPPDRIADFVAVVRQARQAGLKVLVAVTQSDSDYDNPAAATPNAGADFKKLCGWDGGSLKLSAINLDKFKSRLRGLLAALKAARLEVEAFEIGNEIDWVCFNGDVPFRRDASADDIAIAVRGYAKYFAAAVEVIRASGSRAQIITAGLAHIDDSWDRPPRSHLQKPAAFMGSLRNLDGVNYLRGVDGFGAHIYPDANDIAGSMSRVLAEDRAALGAELPVWITEFGFHADQFPNKAGQGRGKAIDDFLKVLEATPAKFGPAFYYAYDDGTYGLIDAQGKLLPEAFSLGKKR